MSYTYGSKKKNWVDREHVQVQRIKMDKQEAINEQEVETEDYLEE